MSNVLTVGADPELFLIDAYGDFVSAIGIVPGTKAEPFNVKNGTVQHDNVAAEVGVIPARSAPSFSRNISAVIADLVEIINKGGFSYSRVASTYFDKELLTSPEAQEFGCDRDWDAYDPSNPCTINKANVDPRFRTAGGHVHIGHSVAKSYPELTILACDLYLGLPSIIMDKDSKRRTLYGQASRYRIQPWGVEYRTLSNFWIFTQEYKMWVFNQVKKVVANPSIVFELDTVVPITDIRRVINSSNKREAIEMLRSLIASGIEFDIPINAQTAQSVDFINQGGF
jgi:hypothetical protein